MITQAVRALPRDQNQTRRLQSALSDLSPSQLQWVSGNAGTDRR